MKPFSNTERQQRQEPALIIATEIGSRRFRIDAHLKNEADPNPFRLGYHGAARIQHHI